ncbi:MAG: type I-MYXAN CRISPR-associated protein Cas6/Cmx6 [Gallionella sp.]
MNESAITDLVFELSGESLPAFYPFALWEALVRQVPRLASDERVGVLPLRGAQNDGQLLLSKRSKLVLRLPEELIGDASGLAGAQLDVAKNILTLGESRARKIQHYPTLHAQLAAGNDDEVEFIAEVQAHFTRLGISARTICGIRHTLSDEKQSIRGYSLVVHDLKPEASIRLQCAGIGEGRRFGCGIFMPYKVITDLD